MPRFHVEVVDSLGNALEPLLIEAPNELDAARLVCQSGSIPLAIRALHSGLLARLHIPLWGKDGIGIDALSLFAEQLAELLSAGLTLEQGLQLLGTRSAEPKQSRFAARLLMRIRAGETLSHALEHESGIPPAFVGVVQGAERGGALADGFKSLTIYLERQREISRRIIASLAYPLVVLVVTIIAIFFILAVVIPEFAPLFAGEEKHLPAVTRAVLFLSNLVANHLVLLMATVVMVGIGVYLALSRLPLLSAFARQLLLHLPPVQYALRLELARTIQVLGALLSSGVEASEAMKLASAVASNGEIRRQFSDGARALREGNSVAETFCNMPNLPVTVTTLIAVGERSGELAKMTTRSACLLESDTNRRIDRFLSVLNPTAVIALGALVALLIAGVMLGILSINQLALR